ncbi:phosphoribosylformylglycinamidine synthase subunit PurS [Candidatus Sumerlaeota bacterium]|nr:phosphoribosylformylglycinamidine synthase subunit PurS [Candidatus Sumerlaeota bacterium]
MAQAKVIVMLKKEVSDVQGVTIQQTMQKLDHAEVAKIRVGKYFEIELNGDGLTKDQLKQKLEDICENVLSNTVVEEYQYELLD